MEYYNMKDTLSNADYNALVYLLRKFKKLTTDLKIGESVIESNYGTFNFSDGFVNIGNNWILEDNVTVTSNDVLKNTFYTFNFTVIDVNTSGVVNRRIVSVTGGTGENGELSIEIPVDLINNNEVILPDYTVEVVFDEHEYYNDIHLNVNLSVSKKFIGVGETNVIEGVITTLDGIPWSNKKVVLTINDEGIICITDENGMINYTYMGVDAGKVIVSCANENIVFFDGDIDFVKATVTGNEIIFNYTSFGVRKQWLITNGDVIIDFGDGTTTTVNNPNVMLSHNYNDGVDEHIITLKGEVTGLGDHCFFDQNNLTSIIIPDSVTKIGESCFYDTGLKSVVIPGSVTSISASAFRNCKSLFSVNISENVKSLGNLCFLYCTNMREYDLQWVEDDIITYDAWIFSLNEGTVFNIPHGTTQDYVDAGYPVSRLVEREPHVFSLILSCDEQIIMKDNVSTVTALLKNNGEGIAGEVLNYVVKHGDNVLDDGSIVTGSDGKASISYTGSGVGDVDIVVSYGTLLQETFVVEDCFKYDTTPQTRTTTYNTDRLTPVYNDFSFVSDNFSLECTWQGSGEGTGVGIAPKDRTTPYHHLLNACGTAQISTYLGNEISGETSARWGSFHNNVDYKFKIEYMNGTVKFYINDELKITYSDKTYLNGETRDIVFLEWNSGNTITLKNIKLKAL